MNVVSFDLCQELYDVSGWNDTKQFYVKIRSLDGKGQGWRLATPAIGETFLESVPAYTSEYLKAQLPTNSISKKSDDGDSLCKLAIDLVRKGKLKKKPKKDKK